MEYKVKQGYNVIICKYIKFSLFNQRFMQLLKIISWDRQWHVIPQPISTSLSPYNLQLKEKNLYGYLQIIIIFQR